MNLREPEFQLDLTPATEFAIAIQAICDSYNLTQDELARFGYVPPLHNMVTGQDRIKRIKKVLVKAPINSVYAAKTELNRPGFSGTAYLDLTCHPTPGGPDPYGFGLYEYEISTERGEKARFWLGRTFLDEGLFGCHYTIVRKSDLTTFYRACLEINKVVIEVDPPILKRGVLEDIWANSIGFLQNASDHREKFKQYKIPVKRAIMLAGRPGCGKCIELNSWVFTSEGMRKIGDFLSTEEEDESSDLKVTVYGIKGQEETDQIYNGGFRETLRLDTRFGYSLTGTPNHKVISTDGRLIQWKRLDKLADGDYVAVPRDMSLFGSSIDLKWAHVPPHYKNPNIKLPPEMTTDLAYFLGLLIGDGCLTIKNRIIFSTAELEGEYMRLCKDLFEVVPTSLNRAGKKVDISFNSVQVYSFLRLIGVSLVGVCEKQVPSAILEAPKSVVIAFLQGLFDTDGWADTTGRVGFDSCSYELANTVHLMLTNFGIISNMRRRENDFNGAWSIDMSGMNALLFYTTIGFRLPRKAERIDCLAKSHNTNCDIVPFSPDLLTEVISRGKFDRNFHKEFRRYKIGTRQLSHNKLAKLCNILADHKVPCVELEELGNRLIFWDKVQTISTSRNYVADFYVPASNSFAANGFMNHNTMTCKWLRQSCIEQGLEFRVITMEEYRRAYSHGKVNSLFNLHGHGNRGIIIFDDMDIMFEDRDKGNHHLTDFLTNLDGCDPSEGVVFVFTSNQTEGLDGAFIRPGRIDLIITFDSPNKELRRRFITERFHPHILEQIDVEELLDRTEVTPQEGENNYPYTYAELEEVRKLLSLDDINKGKVNLHYTLRLFEKHRQEFNERITHFGFGKRLEDDDDYYGFPEDDDEGIPFIGKRQENPFPCG